MQLAGDIRRRHAVGGEAEDLVLAGREQPLLVPAAAADLLGDGCLHVRAEGRPAPGGGHQASQISSPVESLDRYPEAPLPSAPYTTSRS